MMRLSATYMIAMVSTKPCNGAKSDATERLYQEFKLRCQAGFEADWLSAGVLRRLTGLSGRGAIRTRGGAQFDPYRACVGVLRAAVTEGAHIFERCIELKWVEVGADATENVRVDGHAARTSRRNARLRAASRSGAAIGLTPRRTSCSTMSQPE